MEGWNNNGRHIFAMWMEVKGGGGRSRSLLNYGISLDKRLCSKHTKIDPDRPMAELNIYIYKLQWRMSRRRNPANVDFAPVTATELVIGGGYVRGT